MKYSVIIPYRNREQHLQTLLPRLLEKFKEKDYEIIVAEQEDAGPFLKTILMNTAVKHAKGDVLIFHDVDYYPLDNVSYDYDENVGIYPVRNVIFLDENGQEMPDDKIPGGYRMFKHDVGNHSGGVVMVSRELFVKMNGFNPAYRGWGKEDDDFMIRFDYHQIPKRRNEKGTFLALYHPNSEPDPNDQDFQNNVKLVSEFLDTYWLGYSHASADVTEFELEGIPNGRWLKMKNLKVTTKLVSVCLKSRHRIPSLKRTIDAIVATVKTPTDVEVVIKVDEDDPETIEFVKNLNLGDIDLIVTISPRHPLGYYGMAQYDTETARLARGKMFIVFSDDIVCKTPGWEDAIRPYQDTFGIVHGVDDDNGRVKTSWYNSSKLFRTMQWFGTHPHMDRWMNQLWTALPELSIANVHVETSHIKDNLPDPTEPIRPAIYPELEPHQMKEWAKIYNRVKRHLEMIGRRKKDE